MSFDKKPREHKRGFTLVELVIVIAMIALLAAVLIPAFSGIIQRAKHSAALQEARGALTAFAVNTAAQTGADGSDVYVVSKFENGPFYFICANGELKDAPEGSLNRSLEDGEIIGVAVDDSYLIEGETGLEMSDALSSALAEIFGQEPRLNQHNDKAFVSICGKTLEIASQPNLGDTMVFVSSVSLAGTSASSGDVYNDYEIRYAIENKYSIHKDYGPVAGSIMLIITHPDD
ncbi:MAG: prepilin-type N-terminal cleavage/methylation domain-containing protein, partial [Clostridia bacterium]|nr:prepilin-type N-terminal cleavage/methylation domain-containing protein [Clostridia bacterium]